MNESSEINDKINEYIKCEIKEELCENDSLIESPQIYVNLEKMDNTPHKCPIRIESRKYVDSNSRRVGRIKYECCGKIFDDIEDLKTHMLIKHKNDKCKTCGKTFIQQNPQIMPRLQNLYFHKETPNTPFFKKKSLVKDLKKQNETVQENVKVHKCSDCEKIYSRAAHLKRHIKNFHEKNDIKNVYEANNADFEKSLFKVHTVQTANDIKKAREANADFEKSLGLNSK